MKRADPRQLRLDVRLYRVRVDSFETEIQAGSRSAAKYAMFKKGRDAGYFAGGFQDFVNRRPTATELRRAPVDPWR